MASSESPVTSLTTEAVLPSAHFRHQSHYQAPQPARMRPLSHLAMPPSFVPIPDATSSTVSSGYKQDTTSSSSRTPIAVRPLGSASASSSSSLMTEYFPPHPDNQQINLAFQTSIIATSSWQEGMAPLSNIMTPPITSVRLKSPSGKSRPSAKTSRQQFTACGACRHRRVKCDLKQREDVDQLSMADGEAGIGPHRRGTSARRGSVICSNCIERRTNCV